MTERRLPKMFGPKDKDHPSVGRECQACHKPMRAGQHTTLVPLGPGSDEEERKKARQGKFYNSIAIEIHYACATGFVAGSEDE